MFKIKKLTGLMAFLAIFQAYAAQEKKDSALSLSALSLDEAEINEAQDRVVTITSADGETFNVGYNIAMQSKFIKASPDHEAAISIPIKSEILKPLLDAAELIEANKNIENKRLLYESIQRALFNKYDAQTLSAFFSAAVYLDFDLLENVFADKFAQLIKPDNAAYFMQLIGIDQWPLIEKFYNLRSNEKRPRIGNLLIYTNRELQDSLNIDPENIDPENFRLTMGKIIKGWELSVNDLLDYDKDIDIYNNYGLHLNNFYLKSLDGLLRIPGIKNASALYLSDNQIVDLGNSLNGLTNLERLNLSNNQMVDLGNSLNGLINLQWLDLSYNQIVDLGNSLNGLINLKWLFLVKNQIVNLVDALTGLHLTKVSPFLNPLNQASLELLEQINNPPQQMDEQ